MVQPSGIQREPQKVIAIADTTYWGRGYGVLVIRCPKMRKNLHFHEVVTESPAEYLKGRQELEGKGYVIEAAVIDGRRAVSGVSNDVPVQMCQFHQVAIMRRYLTLRPKLEVGKERKAIALNLKTATEKTFGELLDLWHQKWHTFLQERTSDKDGVHWQHTHKKIRSAYRSLKTNLPYLFTCQKYPELKIPNTTNSIDGYFSR